MHSFIFQCCGRFVRFPGAIHRIAGIMSIGIIIGVGYGGDGSLCSELYITPNDALDIALDDGGIAYVACSGAGLQILDLTDPENPVLLGEYPTSNGTMSVDVVGTVAYIADGHNGLRCLDVSDPTSPVLLGTLDFPNFIYEVVVRDGIAYITDGFIDGGLRIVDVQDPANPTLIGSFITDGFAIFMRLEGSMMYLADGSRGLKIIDVGNPANPELVADLPRRGGGWTTCVEVDGGYAYVYENHSLVIYDVSDPSNPVEVGLIDMSAGTSITDMKIVGNGLWTTQFGYPGELVLYGMDSPTELWMWGSIPMSGVLGPILFDSDRVYVLQTDYGIADVPPGEWNGVPGVNTIIDLSGCPACPADLTMDGVLDFFDISEFLRAFTRSRAEADFTQDGVIDFFDISAFLQAFGAGCP